MMAPNATTRPRDVLLFMRMKWFLVLRDSQLELPSSLPVHRIQMLLPLLIQRDTELMISLPPFHLLKAQAQSQQYQMLRQYYPTLIRHFVPLEHLYIPVRQLLLPLLHLPFCHHPMTQRYLPQTRHKPQPSLSLPHYLQMTPP